MLIVRGATLAGLAASARLARLGHRVTLVTGGGPVGGAVAVPDVIAVPAAWRDVFKKSGGHLQAELNRAHVELVEAPPREHVLADGSTLSLPSERGAQYRAVAERFGEAEAARWRGMVDGLDDLWHAYRRHALEGIVPVSGRDRAALWLDVTVADLADRVGEHLAPIVLEAGGSPGAPAVEALSLSAERRFGRWQLVDGDGAARPGPLLLDDRGALRPGSLLADQGTLRPGSLLLDLLRRRVEERGVTLIEEHDGRPDLDATVPDQPLRSGSAEDWLARAPIVGEDGVLRASAASPAGPAPWAELGSAALAVYELHERLTGEDCRPTNVNFTMPRLA